MCLSSHIKEVNTKVFGLNLVWEQWSCDFKRTSSMSNNSIWLYIRSDKGYSLILLLLTLSRASWVQKIHKSSKSESAPDKKLSPLVGVGKKESQSKVLISPHWVWRQRRQASWTLQSNSDRNDLKKDLHDSRETQSKRSFPSSGAARHC